ncbi:aspartate aminotransferase family protein [Pseudomonas gingeri]|uniref:aspartate aminotransferase family protein n=1 Tax=Pseudomonas gingeri TaxID=117681 RepID=UPI0015A1222E|nr:aspartate aminotransferase family protein [Pseudomonas gingeri]NWD04172.1 aspartate aminotransferase family protein [Pseudomonas gingeri]NWE34196.1 aspartate aminotransferase family protein [Pseudomonas gingeri]NWE56552.1 aspartate aminotransferase family protein [Pseudomonas gingeri]NWF01072.1 aspartate aminotransferase family protein [Pseudomonas gingeri]
MSNSLSAAPNAFYQKLISQRPQFEEEYRELTPLSAAYFEAARKVLPGGSTRDSILRYPYPTFISRGEGSCLFDVDGRQLTDFWFSATALPLGHCNAAVVQVAQRCVAKGSAFFAPTEDATRLAELILDRLPAGDKVRFTNSGSEAVMLALRIARGHSGRDIVAKFEGSYHGSYDDVSWSVNPPAAKIGSPLEPTAVPESAGLPSGMGRVLVLPYNDLRGTQALLEKHAGKVAALLVEPLANRMGLILPDRAFIAGLRDLCSNYGIALIFDEVIAFRVGYHGAQGLLGIGPDLTTLGKVIGGGFPVGAVVGREEWMCITEPGCKDGVKHTGTFNANPVTMAAGIAVLVQLTADKFSWLNTLGEYVRASLRSVIAGLPLQVDGEGSLFKITASASRTTDYRSSLLANNEWEETMSLALMVKGFLLTNKLHGCVATTTTVAEVDSLVSEFAKLLHLS